MRNPISERQVRASAIVAGGGPASVRTSFTLHEAIAAVRVGALGAHAEQ